MFYVIYQNLRIKDQVISTVIRALSFLIQIFLLSACIQPAFSNDVLVTVQSQDLSSMNQLTADILNENQNTTSTMRVTLGAIEATMSRVVDSSDAYRETQVQAQPSLTLLNAITFDEDSQSWSFSYNTMQTSSDGNINKYHRILYFSKNLIDIPNSDLENPCLSSMQKNQCIEEMKNNYILSSEASNDDDYFDIDNPQGISTVVTSIQGSKMQEIHITLPHHIIRSALAKRYEVTHPVDGHRIQWVFGIGMLFVPYDNEASAIVIYDRFQLVEISNALLQVSQVTAYSVAEHVSFWTQQAVHDASIYLATIEFLLSPGHVLDRLDMTVNSIPITEEMCSNMQHKILSLNQSACITRYQLCKSVLYTSAEGQQWATLVLPIPAVIASEAEKNINILMQTNYTTASKLRQVVSVMNFASRQPPQQACEDSHVSFFSPVDFTEIMIYRGQALKLQAQSSSFTIDSASIVNSSDAESMLSALLTIIIQPKNTQAATDYFNTFTQEQIKLDDLYMSHSLNSDTFEESFQHHLQTISGGRSNLVLDTSLLALCPEENDPAFVYADTLFTCVTTHDWNLDESLRRPFSSPSHSFVYAISSSSEQNIAWLTQYITGSSQTGVQLATNIDSLVRAQLQPKSRSYWVHPLYAWPDRSPVGLKDTTLVSLAWSLTYSNSLPSRRLLSIPSTKTETQKNIQQESQSLKKINKISIKSAKKSDVQVIPRNYLLNPRHNINYRLQSSLKKK